MRTGILLAVCAASLLPSTASAQRIPFERSFTVKAAAALDVATDRGRIEITAGEPGRIVVTGTVTVRAGLNVPADAIAIAQATAANPPVRQDGQTVTLRTPADAAAGRAVTISYQVRVPADTAVHTDSDSGATTIRGVSGPVSIRTQSAAIDVAHVGGGATIDTGSGAVSVDGSAGAVSVTTHSSGFTGRSIGGHLRARTESGAIDATLSGEGDVDVETGSSAIRVGGSRGGISARSRSGRIVLDGAPRRDWMASAGSSSVEVSLDPGAGITLDASSGSSSVTVSGVTVQGTVTKGKAAGTVGAGGPLVRLESRSGSVVVRRAPAGR